MERDGLAWRKSSRSASNGACVEVADLRDGVAVRDSKDPDGPVLRFAGQSWRDFIGVVRAGGFDRPLG
jgi:hypothetical protein